MCDKLVFDLAQEVEGSPNIFVRKDWVNILDNQNQNYNNNQSILDTSQLSNSNKYMSYREAYFLIPMLITLTSNAAAGFNPVNQPCDFCVGLKNWFGQIIHSFTLDYNGTTIVQQTPFVNMWNSFKLMTSLSWSDVETQGPTIGFYPDDPDTWLFVPRPAPVVGGDSVVTSNQASGMGVCNNVISNSTQDVVNPARCFNQFRFQSSNKGYTKRTQYINYDATNVYAALTNQNPVSALLSTVNARLLWKSHISNKVNSGAGTAGVYQISITATVYLKHIHSFFNMCPLLKGVFMKMTMNLNNTTCVIGCGAAGVTTPSERVLICKSVNNALGGVNPLMVTSAKVIDMRDTVASDDVTTTVRYLGGSYQLTNGGAAQNEFRISLSVGARCLDQQQASIQNVATGTMAQSIYLYIPAYTFNPTFEQAYLSDPVKEIKYTDIYQYQVVNIAGQGQGQFNNLLTNGIANVKSVLILPFFSSATAAANSAAIQYPQGAGTVNVSDNTGFLTGYNVFQSPFDPAGTGPTSPLCHITNFNVQVSGQNAIYNLQKYGFEQFNNQLYGVNAVNGGQTDGLTSSLINRHAFDMNYCYYYVNIERMLPVEESVPKSIQIIGTNLSEKAVDLYCFVEYGNSISIDALTGARI
jgi:hypothetical protein